MDTSNIASKLLHRGAEAELSLATIGPWRVVIKHRVKKEYRNPSLDEQIRHDRTISEASRIHEAKTAGARVPSIVGIDIENNAIVMTTWPALLPENVWIICLPTRRGNFFDQ